MSINLERMRQFSESTDAYLLGVFQGSDVKFFPNKFYPIRKVIRYVKTVLPGRPIEDLASLRSFHITDPDAEGRRHMIIHFTKSSDGIRITGGHKKIYLAYDLTAKRIFIVAKKRFPDRRSLKTEIQQRQLIQTHFPDVPEFAQESVFFQYVGKKGKLQERFLEPFCPEEDLGVVIEKKTLSLEQKHFFLRKLIYLGALLELHGLVHRDLKPANVLCKRNLNGWPVPVIIDFESLISVNDRNEEKEIMGSLDYISPEYLRLLLYQRDHELQECKEKLTKSYADIFVGTQEMKKMQDGVKKTRDEAQRALDALKEVASSQQKELMDFNAEIDRVSTPALDAWGFGCIIYETLFHLVPRYHPIQRLEAIAVNQAQLFQEVDLPGDPLMVLAKQMLDLNPQTRLTALGACKKLAEWFPEPSGDSVEYDTWTKLDSLRMRVQAS